MGAEGTYSTINYFKSTIIKIGHIRHANQWNKTESRHRPKYGNSGNQKRSFQTSCKDWAMPI